MIYLIAILVFFTVWALGAVVLFKLINKNRPIDKLKHFDEDYTLKEKFESNKNHKISPLKLLSNLVPETRLNKKKNEKIEDELMKADLQITSEELLVIKILSSSAVSFLVYAVSKDYFMPLIVFILIWNIPRFVISKRKKDRIKTFDSQLNEGITIISNSLKAGYSFLQAVAVVTEETKDPFSKEFKKLLKEMSLGISEEESLKSFLERMESEDLRLVINAILIQKDIGGNLSEILDNISETIRERQKIKGELRTLTAQGKLSGIIVMLIPIFLGAFIYVFNKKYMMVLFTTPTGIAMISASIISEIFGLLIIRKIVNIEM